MSKLKINRIRKSATRRYVSYLYTQVENWQDSVTGEIPLISDSPLVSGIPLTNSYPFVSNNLYSFSYDIFNSPSFDLPFNWNENDESKLSWIALQTKRFFEYLEAFLKKIRRFINRLQKLKIKVSYFKRNLRRKIRQIHHCIFRALDDDHSSDCLNICIMT